MTTIPTSAPLRALCVTAALAVLLCLALGLSAGCAQTVRAQAGPALGDQEAPITKVAVVPFRVTGGLARQRDEKVGPGPTDAAAKVTQAVAEALMRRGVSVVPPDEVARALALEAGSTQRLVPLAVARALHARFGVDAVLLGETWRYVEREGQAAGTLRPASVGFEVVLHTAPGGQRLWTGTFDETQQALSENVVNAGRYPGGGTRWLTAEELLRWGANETARALPLSP